MGRKAIQEACKVCGSLARRINYVSSAKGKVYYYTKYVHSNGITHYYRLRNELPSGTLSDTEKTLSVFDALDNILDVKKKGRELIFGEIKSLVEKSYGRTVSTATIYRNLSKMMKLDLINKRNQGNIVFYSRKLERSTIEEFKTMKLSIGFDFTGQFTFVTIFVNIKNLGIKLINSFPISLPVGVIDSLSQIGFMAFDETKKIPMNRESIAYSYADQTGISITLDRPLRKLEEENFFINYVHKSEGSPVNIFIPADLDYLKIICEVQKGKEVEIKKRLGDGLKEIEPTNRKRTGNEIGHRIIEAEFENAVRGDTIVISLGK
ncbi:MAG: helix-turn-helix domain-containing protein [Candidatus Thermoplasmatota archaeon]|jgi:hypothetical protein|nr:helix-turn-helix domain-containing protein [Candidatus Thermoplasmatota archaeon]MCL6002969.1 helix-turn-helix domain-containing protein [Candidatus Thermoplasmatota archaeon]